MDVCPYHRISFTYHFHATFTVHDGGAAVLPCGCRRVPVANGHVARPTATVLASNLGNTGDGAVVRVPGGRPPQRTRSPYGRSASSDTPSCSRIRAAEPGRNGSRCTATMRTVSRRA